MGKGKDKGGNKRSQHAEVQSALLGKFHKSQKLQNEIKAQKQRQEQEAKEQALQASGPAAATAAAAPKKRKHSEVTVEVDGEEDDGEQDEQGEEDNEDGTEKDSSSKEHTLQPNLRAHKDPTDQEVETLLRESVLPEWLARPIAVSSDLAGGAVPIDALEGTLAEPLQRVLAAQGIDSLFPVQATLLPLLLPDETALVPPGDLLVSAPTGSGKTLGYVLPIVQALHRRVVVRLRALILLPTRELVAQVAEVLKPFADETGLKIASITGQSSFANEQRQLVVQMDQRVQGGCSRVDIVVATPGRLVDHLAGTPNFTLQDLRYLVVDEADRLLNQSYQDWLNKVQEAADATLTTTTTTTTTTIGDAVQPHDALSRRFNPRHPLSVQPTDVPLQKLLFSATLTRNPSKLAALHLIRPRSVSVSATQTSSSSVARFTFAPTLQDTFVVCRDDQKPLVLMHLLHSTRKTIRSVVCFASSVEATHRLFRLLQLHGRFSVAEFSSALKQNERAHMLAEFRAGKVRVLVCSDGMARGMDVASVDAVVSYDAPPRIQTHVHRVGRTARAGRAGIAFTLMAPREVKHFKVMIAKNDSGEPHKLHRYKLTSAMIERHIPSYEKALESLKDAMQQEKYQKIDIPHIAYASGDNRDDDDDGDKEDGEGGVAGQVAIEEAEEEEDEEEEEEDDDAGFDSLHDAVEQPQHRSHDNEEDDDMDV